MKCRRGFTLIEVVAVLAILGTITAMALPKYFSIMNEGKYKVAQAAAAEGHARVNMWGMSQYLQSGAWPTVDQYESAADLIGRDTGEFVLHYMKENETTLKVSAKGQVATNFEGVEATLRITPPGNGGP
jgi:prepilin-type N-terminal cleavage/methylation domain-containing protein